MLLTENDVSSLKGAFLLQRNKAPYQRVDDFLVSERYGAEMHPELQKGLGKQVLGNHSAVFRGKETVKSGEHLQAFLQGLGPVRLGKKEERGHEVVVDRGAVVDRVKKFGGEGEL